MKKLFSLFALLLFFIPSVFSQNWKTLKEENGVKVEYSYQEQNIGNKTGEFVVIKFTNTSNQDIDFEFDVLATYATDIERKMNIDSGDEKAIHLNSGESKESTFTIFSRWISENKSRNLIKFDINLKIE